MKLRPFELILVVAFGVLGVLALVLLANYKPNDTPELVALSKPVVIWGTVPSSVFYAVLSDLTAVDELYRNVSYVKKEVDTFDSDLINALAEDRGPDVLFLPHEELVQHRSKIQPVTYEQYPKRDFESTYIDGASVFALSDGIYALPVAVDPMVMYWNRDILGTQNFLTAPKTWEELVTTMLPSLIERDFNRTVIRAGVAFGEYQNVKNAFGMLSTLLIQGGSALVSEGRENTYQINLNKTVKGDTGPFTNALIFYTNFSNPSNPLYTWNRAQTTDFQAFGREELAFYFGKGSEAASIAQQNPNLNFDIAEMPQGATASVKRTYGTFYGFALMRAARNPAGGMVAMQALSGGTAAQAIVNKLAMAPVYRSAVSSGSDDRYGRIIYSTAPVARGWLNPELGAVSEIFTMMIEDVQSNRTYPSGATSDAVSRLGDVY